MDAAFWAVLATFTTYFGGIILDLLINNKNTKLKKMWRTLFCCSYFRSTVCNIAVALRNFFANTGIVNSFCKNIGLVDL